MVAAEGARREALATAMIELAQLTRREGEAHARVLAELPPSADGSRLQFGAGKDAGLEASRALAEAAAALRAHVRADVAYRAARGEQGLCGLQASPVAARDGWERQ